MPFLLSGSPNDVEDGYLRLKPKTSNVVDFSKIQLSIDATDAQVVKVSGSASPYVYLDRADLFSESDWKKLTDMVLIKDDGNENIDLINLNFNIQIKHLLSSGSIIKDTFSDVEKYKWMGQKISPVGPIHTIDLKCVYLNRNNRKNKRFDLIFTNPVIFPIVFTIGNTYTTLKFEYLN